MQEKNMRSKLGKSIISPANATNKKLLDVKKDDEE